MSSNFYKKAFLLLLIFHSIAYGIFRYLATAPQTYDSAGHIALAFKFANLYKDFLTGGPTTVYDILTTSFYYPPLLHLTGGLLALVFGKSINLLLTFGFLFFLGCLVMLRRVIEGLGFGPKVAFFTAVFYSFFPFIADQSRLYHTDIPMTFFVLTALYWLLKSDYFTNSKYALLFFITTGLGMLVRWFVPVYLAIPVLFYLYQAKEQRKSAKKILLNFFIGSIVFLCISLPWYLVNFELFRTVSSFFSQGEKDDPQIFWSMQNFTYYIRDLVTFQVPLPLHVLAIIGAVKFYKAYKYKVFLLVGEVVLIYFFFTLIKNKNGRYILGILPIYAFFAAYAFDYIKQRYKKIILVGFSGVAFLFTTFNQLPAASNWSKLWGFTLMGPWGGGFYNNPTAFSYQASQFNVTDLVSRVQTYATENTINPVGVIYTIDAQHISAANLELMRAQKDFTTMYFATPYFKEQPFESDYALIKYIRDKGTVVMLDADYQGPDNQRHYPVLVQMHNFLKNQGQYWFTKLESVKSPHGDISIYLRKPFNTEFVVGTCKELTITNGTYTMAVDPLASAVIYTSPFTYGGVYREAQTGTSRLLVITNSDLTPQTYIVSDLPQKVSICHRMGTQLNLLKEISQPLLSPALLCGSTTCKTIEVTQYTSALTFTTQAYTSTNFVTPGFTGLAKRTKLIPYFEETYSLKKDILNELKR